MTQSLNDLLYAGMPLCKSLEMRAVEGTPQRVAIELDWRAELCTTAGALHGGVIMALADSAGGMCAFLNLPDGATGTSTIESKTNFMGAVRDGVVTATATPLHIGGTTIVIETDVTRADGKRVAKTIQTQVVLR
jgi:1,4-dihydroxy-2-naphthoyl-CoA hydrolase